MEKPEKLKIVLHACCGPCSTVPLRVLGEQGHDITIFYSNSNIHPEAEYLRRRDTIAAYAAELGIAFVEGTYDPNSWMRAIGDERAYGVERCARCYRHRFAEPAAYAAQVGADALASSLTISPYQFTAAINAELVRAAELAGVQALQADYRDRYPDSVRLSREAGMYRQNFCGCMFSQVEAQEQRDAARARRKAAKAARKQAEKGGSDGAADASEAGADRSGLPPEARAGAEGVCGEGK